jgi:hypothetical protein
MKKIKILFQGDSITDAGRDRSDIHNLGQGYPKYAAELLKDKYPDAELNLSISASAATAPISFLTVCMRI